VAGVIASALTLGQTSAAWAEGASPASPSAAAAPTKAELATAKKRYGEGDKKFKAGDYAGALADFTAANDIKSTPQAERYIGLCEDALGHSRKAAEWFEKFLAHVPEKLASQGDEIKKRLAEIQAMPGKVHVESTPPGASVAVDDKAQPSPTPADLELPPGSHTITLASPGHLPATRTVDVTFASSQSVSAELAPEPPPPPPPVAAAPPPPPPAPPPPPKESRSKVPAFATGALAVAAAGVGTVFGVIALGDKSDFDKNPTTSKADDGDTHALIADMAFGVAITFGVTSAVLFLTKDDETPAAASTTEHAPSKTVASKSVTLTPTPFVGPHSGGGGFLLRF
jgi:hypothetical protein